MRRLCTMEGCGGTLSAKGLCQKHYMRMRRTGTTDAPVRSSRQCEVDGCFRPHQALGLCYLHWKQQYDSQRRARDRAARAADRAGRLCLECGGPVPPERNTRALYCTVRCKNRALTRGRQRKYYLSRKHGMTEDEFDALLATQGGVCGICAGSEPGGRGTWSVDHDHFTGLTRGVLCNACNLGLGKFKDDPALLRRAVKYLERMT